MNHAIVNQQKISGSLLIASMLVALVGVRLYSSRGTWYWLTAGTAADLLLERGAFMLAVILTALGLVLLARLLQAAASPTLASIGLSLILIGSVLMLAAEAIYLLNGANLYSAIVTYVILVSLGQAVLGVALLRTHLLPAWAGWFTIVWNLGGLILLFIFSPDDLYYPGIHHFAPLMIGIALLLMEHPNIWQQDV